jgi:hypothetical protein
MGNILAYPNGMGYLDTEAPTCYISMSAANSGWLDCGKISKRVILHYYTQKEEAA